MSTATETKKKEPGMAQLVLVLFAICAVTALLLGLVNMITAPAIAANTEKKTAEAKAAVLAAETYAPVEYTGDPMVKNIWKADDKGYVVEVTPSGFGGNLDVMVGVDNDGVCTGVSIISHAETSGLGANATKESFRDQFVGKSGTVAVTKDGGEINALTGATITSRAVSNGVTAAIAAVGTLG